MSVRHAADGEATVSAGLRVTGARTSYLVVPVRLIRDFRRSGASGRTRSVILGVIMYLAVPPAGVAAQVATTELAEFLPPLSFGMSRLDDTGLRDRSTTSSPENAERRSFSTGEVLDPIPKTSSLTFQPTYVHRTDGTYQAYVQLKPVIVVESGLPLFTRIEWPIPDPAALRDQALARFVVRADAADHHPGLPQEREQCPQ